MTSIARITTGWTLTRVVYLLLGSALVWQSLVDNQWLGVALGGYFAAMGVFAFGCAAGNCYGGKCSTGSEQNVTTDV
jgi:hypothetical protein